MRVLGVRHGDLSGGVEEEESFLGSGCRGGRWFITSCMERRERRCSMQ